jgi:hypothetical protein
LILYSKFCGNPTKEVEIDTDGLLSLSLQIHRHSTLYSLVIAHIAPGNTRHQATPSGWICRMYIHAAVVCWGSESGSTRGGLPAA